MSYPFDPHYGVDRRSGGVPDRVGAADRRFGKSQNSQSIRPGCLAPCFRTIGVPGLVFNLAYNPPSRPPTPPLSRVIGPIVWADSNDHNKTFGVNLRDGFTNTLNLSYVNLIAFDVSDEVNAFTNIYSSAVSLYVAMYYKTGAEIVQSDSDGAKFFSATSAITLAAHTPPASFVGHTYIFVPELTTIATQAWEVAGSQAKELYPSGFALAANFTSKSSINIAIDPLLILSRRRS